MQAVLRFLSTAGISLTIGGTGSTKMYCTSPEGAMEQESLYLSLLGTASSYAFEAGKLVIRDASGTSILVFASGLDDTPETFIDYTRTGGFGGFNDHLVISSDGTATVTRKETTRQVRVPELTMRKLTAHLSAADFPSLKSEYPAPEEGADYFTYTLTHDGKTVVTEDTGVPPILVPIINVLNEIIESAALLESAIGFCRRQLKPGGAFLAKVFQGEEFEAVLAALKAAFREVCTRKPAASRGESRETYLLARGLTGL